jgi:transcriptional regulator with XRE-family HTH domain
MDAGRLAIFKRTAYWKETNTVILQCARVAEQKGMNLSQFAELCDLSPQTLRNNIAGVIGLPQQLTLWKMCAGAGFKLEIMGRPREKLRIGDEMSNIRRALRRKPQKKRKKKKKKGKRT